MWIVNIATNAVIGEYSLYYSDVADNAKTIPANDTAFSITIPSGLGDTCSTAGACVVQHYWNAPSIDQTYESCVDFVIGGSSSGSWSTGVATSTAVSSSAVGESSSVAATSSSVAVTASSPVAASVITLSSTVPTTIQTVVSQASTSTKVVAGVLVPLAMIHVNYRLGHGERLRNVDAAID